MLGEVPNPHEMKTGLYPSIAQNSRGETSPDEVSDPVKVQIAIEMENCREKIKKEVKEEIKTRRGRRKKEEEKRRQGLELL